MNKKLVDVSELIGIEEEEEEENVVNWCSLIVSFFKIIDCCFCVL